MRLSYNPERIDNALYDFYNATGINIRILDENFSTISSNNKRDNKYCSRIKSTRQGLLACMKSDAELLCRCRDTKQLQLHTCHAGLTDIAVPILYNGRVMGYIILGQIKINGELVGADVYTAESGISEAEAGELYASLPLLDKKKTYSIANIAKMLAEYLLIENMLVPGTSKNLDAAIRYINDNLSEPLSVSDVSDAVNLSKSALYKIFHKYFDCTVGEYINMKRIEKAVTYLVETDCSIEEVARLSGFSSQAYFTGVFKKIKGTTPLKYRSAVMSEGVEKP